MTPLHPQASARWKAIAGYEGFYEVSDRGDVRILTSNGGRLLNPRPKAVKQHRGYVYVNLWKGNTTRTFRLHRLILEAFVGAAPDGHEAMHLDGDRLNNHLSNLAWGTRKENHAQKRQHGTHHVGERSVLAKLNDEAVREIRRARAAGESRSAVATKFGVTCSCIVNVERGTTWRHVR